jgi:hypothetical protein
LLAAIGVAEGGAEATMFAMKAPPDPGIPAAPRDRIALA